jgi:hypothetical protein
VLPNIADGSKTVVAPLKWDVCITPEGRHRSATLPTVDVIVCYGNVKPADTHLASVIHCIDGEIAKWLERREQRRRGKQPPSRCRAIDNPNYDESHQNDYPIGNLDTHYRCFPAKPFHGPSSQLDQPHLGGLTRFQHPNDITDFQTRSGYSGHTQKAAKVSLDGSCRCVCVEVLRRAVLERSPCSLLFGRTRPSMRPVGALPLCRVNDPRSLSHVTGGDALQASDAVPFDKMANAGFQLSALSIIISDQDHN